MPRLKSGLSGAALGAALGAIVGAVMAVPAWPQVTGSTASIRVGSGPHKGEYAFAPTETCVIAAFGDRPSGLSVVLHSTEAVLSVDVPDVEKRASEIQVVLVISERQAGKVTSSVTYEVDTRPDSALEPFQKAERAKKGMTGKMTTTLMQQGDSALVSFTGQTASGVKLDGSVTCKKM
ncbi:MAG TPA: hypothetical protein VFL16_18300 [Steroidobacteraceae bacterium]|jgi:hypothetical protein|nr:hypothetical protein [Steroidobacteraceae bacterium]